MAFPSCLCRPQFSLKIDCSQLAVRRLYTTGVGKKSTFFLKAMNTQFFGQSVVGLGAKLRRDWISIPGSPRPNPRHFVLRGKSPGVYASWLASPQIASSVFTLGTVAVLPFYTLMVLAPKAELTRKSMESNIPYVVLGFLYAYLLYLSWTPDTIRLMFASKYWLPELPGIAKMFSSEMTLVSAWIHLLAVDLFAARQVFHDGLENRIETRHSVSLCLLFCPIGIVTHVITKALSKGDGNAEHSL